jgi:hypothetical protein
MKFALVCPADTVTVGREAARSMRELVSETTVPPEGAGASSVTIQVAVPPLPPVITDGLQVREVAVMAEKPGKICRNATLKTNRATQPTRFTLRNVRPSLPVPLGLKGS